MNLRETIIKRLKEYRKEHNYNTYQLRKLERAKQPKPVAGINVTTLNQIEKDPNYIPTKAQQINLLDFLEIPYEKDSWNNIKHIV